jgi:hypothetical protein
MMDETITPNPKALEEALQLSEQILKNIELSEIPLSSVALETSRLARLLNDFDYQKIMEYEAGGYPSMPAGLPPDIFRLGELAGRKYQQKDVGSLEVKEYIYIESIEQLEEQLRSARIGIEAAQDRDVSISSANPNQWVTPPMGNILERQGLQNKVSALSRKLSSRRTFIYQYALRKHYELKFSGVVGDLFSRIRETSDSMIGTLIPDAVQKFSAVYDNLRSENPEDWSNAVHSCRRILQDLADAVFPPQSEDRIIKKGEKEKRIKLGTHNYINRIMCFVEDNSKSRRFIDLVGSHLDFLGNRLDSIFEAAQKGSHDTIVSREEADRYVVYTYMIVADILSLRKSIESNTNQERYTADAS